ncbi:MAG TPA: hypothetical protein VGK32_23265 [Vicinamibacterales bacterium]
MTSTPVATRLPLCAFLVIIALACVTTAVGAQSGPTAPPPKPATPASQAAKGGSPATPENDVLPSRPVYGSFFGSEALHDLPTSRTIWSLIETADAMVVVDRIQNGGLYLGETPRLGSWGSSWTQVGFSMDGLDLTDPDRTGTPLLRPELEVLQAVSVSSVFLPAEASGSGPVVRLFARRPSDSWRATVQASLLPHALQGENSLPTAPSIAKFGSAADGSLLIAGPVVPGRLGLLMSARTATTSRFERNDPAELHSRATSLFMHGVFTPSADSQLRIVASLDGARHPFDGRVRFADRSVSGSERYWHLHGVWERLQAGASTISAVIGYQRGVYSGPDGTLGVPTVATVERLKDGPVPQLMGADKETHARIDGALRFQWIPGGPSGRHRVNVGVSLSRQSSITDSVTPAVIGELVDGLPARIWRYSFGGSTPRESTDLAAWVDSRLALGSRLNLNAAARIESTRASLSGTSTGASIAWNTILPRVALRYQFTDSGRVSAFFGYAAHRDRLPLNYLAYGDPAGLSAQVYRWNDTNRDRIAQSSETGPLVSVIGPGGGLSSIDPDLRAPVSDEIAFGFQAKFGRHWLGRLSAIDRRARDLVAPVNVGVTASDYAIIQLWDRGNDFVNPADDRYLQVYNRNPASFGRDRYLLTNGPDATGRYVGIDLAVERLFDGRWHMMFGGSAHRSDGYGGNRGFLVTENDVGVLGEAFENPNALTYDRGRLFFDRGYVVKWSAGGMFAHDLYVGAIARYQDGQQFARMVIVPNLNQGPEAIQGHTRGQTRFTFVGTVDARVEKGLRFGSRRLALVVEVFNILNTGKEVEEDPTVTRDYRATTAVEPPRAFRLGLRFDF